jgi:starch-binding outer membrane protein, SusD/RagB family
MKITWGKRIVLFLLIIPFSCSEEFFDKEPMGSSAETIFCNEKGINSLLIGAYGIIGGGALWEVNWVALIQNWIYGSVASDDAYKGSEATDESPIPEIERWEVSSTNHNPADKWKLCLGMGVYRCNDILRVIGMTEGLDPDVEAEFRAEARFLRALYTFEAWLVFGDKIPILTLETIAAAGGDTSKISNNNPPHAVLNQIIDDLTYAADNLPHRQSQPGRPTRWAAKALVARTYLQELNYTAAKPLLDEIINDGGFYLMHFFLDNYRIALENNAESIFEIQASVNDGACCSGNAEMGIGMNFPHGSDIGMCCSFHQPSQNLVNAFRVDTNGLPMFDTFNDTDLKNDQDIRSEDTFIPFTDEVDPRLDWTVSRRGIPYRDWGINRGYDWIRDQSYGGPYLPASKPFFYQSERYTLSTTTGWMTGVNANNFRYIRLTHVLLWRAECAAFEGDLETARTYVNMIRDRAGNEIVMGKVQMTELPPSVYPWGPDTDEDDYLVSNAYIDWSQPAANYKIGQYPPFADSREAMRAVQWELRLEFATEGMRFFDLRRWNNLPANFNSMPMAATLNAFAEADLRIRTYMRDAHFDIGKDEYQPIPKYQIDLQPGVLIQNPGY